MLDLYNYSLRTIFLVGLAVIRSRLSLAHLAKQFPAAFLTAPMLAHYSVAALDAERVRQFYKRGVGGVLSKYPRLV